MSSISKSGEYKMKIIHCADLHLDSKLTANLTQEKAKERKTELLHTFQAMVEYAASEQVQAILIAGDLFDTKKVSVKARDVVYQAIMNHPQIAFYYLRGNHDADSFLASLDVTPDNLHLFGEDWTSYALNEQRTVLLTGIEITKENENTMYHSLVLNTECFNMVTLHGQITEQSVGNATEVIRLRELKNKGIDYLALGHVHAYQKDALDARGTYCYPGCLEGRGFDECGQHGFVLLNIDEENLTCMHTFIPFAKRVIHEITVDISECMHTDDVAVQIEDALKQTEVATNDLVRFRLCGAVDIECEYSLQLLEDKFADRFYFMKMKDRTTRKVNYTAFALDQSLKGEFVRTVFADETLSDEEKAAIVRYGIQALSGEEIG